MFFFLRYDFKGVRTSRKNIFFEIYDKFHDYYTELNFLVKLFCQKETFDNIGEKHNPFYGFACSFF